MGDGLGSGWKERIDESSFVEYGCFSCRVDVASATDEKKKTQATTMILEAGYAQIHGTMFHEES